MPLHLPEGSDKQIGGSGIEKNEHLNLNRKKQPLIYLKKPLALVVAPPIRPNQTLNSYFEQLVPKHPW